MTEIKPARFASGLASPQRRVFNPADQSVDKSPDTAAARNREKVTGFLADLLGFPTADRQPQAKADRLNLYESMSRGLGGELRSTGPAAPSPDSQQGGRTAIYENCFKCQGDRCRPPPQVIWTTQALPTGPRASQEHGGTHGREEGKRPPLSRSSGLLFLLRALKRILSLFLLRSSHLSINKKKILLLASFSSIKRSFSLCTLGCLLLLFLLLEGYEDCRD